MRVMHVMAGAAEGGAENIMLESVLALAEAGLTQHVVTRPDNQFRVQKFREAGIGVDVAAFNNTLPFPTRRVLGDAIKAFKPDVVIASAGFDAYAGDPLCNQKLSGSPI